MARFPRGIQPAVGPLGGSGKALEHIATSLDGIKEGVEGLGQDRGDLHVRLKRALVDGTPDQVLWVVIRNSTEALSFNNYNRFLELVVCGQRPKDSEENDAKTSGQAKLGQLRKRALPFPDVEMYRVLKTATEAFMMVNCGVAIDFEKLVGDLGEERRRLGREVTIEEMAEAWNEEYLTGVNGGTDLMIPYLAPVAKNLKDVRVVDAPTDLPQAQDCYGIIRKKLTNPCLMELIWSYWMEEAMLVQTANTISLRFQNKRGPAERDPLAHLAIDPLRPLSNLLWGYVQDEQHRLSVQRRAYEYDHEYGLPLYGKAVAGLRPADTRTKFLEAFHNLLRLCTIFYKQDDDTTVIADGFPVLNGLKEVHLLLSEGAHNQYGDLPWTARQEMLMQQWLLARPEMREFLPSRIMVAYPEPWMDQVDTMKKLQGWNDVSVMHFGDLADFGEKVLLSVRFGNWNDIHDRDFAANWARYWRPEIQGYIHAYRTVTGVDLAAGSAAVDATPPAVHIRRRLELQRKAS